MGSVAKYYLDHLSKYLDFNLDDKNVMVSEKLAEVMMQRILRKEDTSLAVHYKDGAFYDGNWRYSSDSACERLLADDDCVFARILDEGFSAVGEVSELFQPVHGGFDSLEDAEAWFSCHTPLELVNRYLYSLSPEALGTLPKFCNNMFDYIISDPLNEETDFFVTAVYSRLIGSFLSTTHIPDGIKRYGMELLDIVRDPFGSRFAWDGVNKGEYVLVLLNGCMDYTEWVSLSQLYMNWLPAVISLKEEILRLNTFFHFYEEPERKEENGYNEVSRLCA